MIERQRCKFCNTLYEIIDSNIDLNNESIIEYPLEKCENCFGQYMNKILKEVY